MTGRRPPRWAAWPPASTPDPGPDHADRIVENIRAQAAADVADSAARAMEAHQARRAAYRAEAADLAARHHTTRPATLDETIATAHQFAEWVGTRPGVAPIRLRALTAAVRHHTTSGDVAEVLATADRFTEWAATEGDAR